MVDHTAMENFLRAADAWVCDGYFLDIRYLATRRGQEWDIWDALVGLSPLPTKVDSRFQIRDDNLLVGQIQQSGRSKRSLMEALTQAASGNLQVGGEHVTLVGTSQLSFYTEMTHRDRSSSDLHLQVTRNVSTSSDPAQLSAMDGVLRRSAPPFDGLSDVTAWLGLSTPGSGFQARLVLRVLPPVDLRYDKCSLSDNKLRLTISSVPGLDVSTVGVALRVTPGDGITSRFQAASAVRWGKQKNGIREGTVKLTLKNADNVLTMLTLGALTVRRQWFWDPKRARNNRLLAVQHFDEELKMVRSAVLDSDEAAKFECGVACLLFLLGFSPAVQLERDAPDLVVTTPGGRLALVECTTRIADFSEKLGKLVDRRGALAKSLRMNGHPALITAALVCRLPRDQIAARADELRGHKVLLLTGEDLAAAFDRLRFASEPDTLIEEAEARLARNTIL